MRANVLLCRPFMFFPPGLFACSVTLLSEFSLVTLKPEVDAALQGCGEEPELFVWCWEALGGQLGASAALWL